MTAAETDNDGMTPADMKRWRFEMGLTQVAAARLLDVSPRQVSAWECGEFPIPLAVAYACKWLQGT